eukprot:CAMPEP_0180689126 /NCGR_PEP_ID=MMETSP1037_2-20121125/74334_1 /TAXON_ID=632150 /ORGANISM="Azadinium spinosum, Strain 3D9" /LENGTH=161 /DNA_ID=CAMNT_0022719985 /DNA_START=13 /DNA_END=498 /DNA_ORIENTATION=+
MHNVSEAEGEVREPCADDAHMSRRVCCVAIGAWQSGCAVVTADTIHLQSQETANELDGRGDDTATTCDTSATDTVEILREGIASNFPILFGRFCHGLRVVHRHVADPMLAGMLLKLCDEVNSVAHGGCHHRAVLQSRFNEFCRIHRHQSGHSGRNQRAVVV